MELLSKKALISVLICLTLGVAVFLLYFYSSMAPQQPQTEVQNQAQTPKNSTQVIIGDTTVQVEVESTEASREQGLSGRVSLAEGSGMLFVFDRPSNYGFWMKDMNFALDMLFADANGRIVTIARDATPESYKQNPPQVFYPNTPILYVLEVPAGFTARHDIEEGMTLQIR